jgi:hypothetical protein
MKEWFEGKRVAVVGNAMHLFDREYGREIDSHDVVVRINRAAVLYTEHEATNSHGQRTDVWIFWNTGEYKSMFPKIDPKIKKMHAGHQGRSHNNISQVDFVYPDSLYKVLKPKAGKHGNPTTGLILLDYLSTCNPALVSVYGFDWKKTPTFTDPKMKRERHCPHDYRTEREYCMKTFFSRDDFVLKP